MNRSNTVAEWRARRRAIQAGTLGFVPTMGALHRGHASLIDRCRAENDVVAVSIFVNPSQFNDPGDLDRYPRTMDHDLDLLEALRVDEVFVPAPAEIYPKGYRLRVEPQAPDLVLEAAYRPGFLQGVLTVVLKLLNLVGADRAYFGEKDYQQLRAIKELVEEFFISTQIIACPTLREESGLAMSSRNALLTTPARSRAAQMYRALTTSCTPDLARAHLEREGFRVEYVEERWNRRLAAAFLEGVRLIDNVALAEIGIPEISQ